jgi:Flp pilus assembly pilin Flp
VGLIKVVQTPIQRSKDVKVFEEFFRDERGAELAEYAVGTAILVAIAIVVYQVLGSAVNVKMNAVANEIQK